MAIHNPGQPRRNSWGRKVLELLEHFPSGLSAEEMAPLLGIDVLTLRPKLIPMVRKEQLRIKERRPLSPHHATNVYVKLTADNFFTT